MKLKAGLVVVLVIFLLWVLTTAVMAQGESPPSESDIPLDCLSHHVQVLKGHDKLGEGNEACWSCHLSTQMTTLHLAGGETLPLSDFPRLCAQCHQKRYEAWNEGTHGVPAWKEGDPWTGDSCRHVRRVVNQDVVAIGAGWALPS